MVVLLSGSSTLRLCRVTLAEICNCNPNPNAGTDVIDALKLQAQVLGPCLWLQHVGIPS